MSAKLRQPGIFGQLCWDTYTLVILGFPDRSGSSQNEVLATLDTSAQRLLSAFPFLAGQVVKRGQTTSISGTYEIVPYPSHENISPVRRRDCSELCPTYEQIIHADAPFAMLDGDLLCPMKGMGHAYDSSTELPVFIVQANFIKGGLLLCFASMHNALDMNGQGLVMKLFAAAARGEEFDSALIEGGNADADNIVPLLRPGERALMHENMRRPSILNTSGQSIGPPRPAIWSYWRFSQDTLAELKKSASSGKNLAVRVASGQVAANEDVHLQRAVDSRSVLQPPVPEGYMGHLVAVAETVWQSAHEITESSLADVAVKARTSLRGVDDHFVRSLATLISTTEDKTTIFYGVKNKPGRDLLVSSWAQLHWLSQCDFGPGLGTVDFVRRARLPEVPDLYYIMPKDKHGNMHLAACMFHEDHVGLVNDTAWRQYAKLVG